MGIGNGFRNRWWAQTEPEDQNKDSVKTKIERLAKKVREVWFVGKA